nr:hypothetical protein [Tanacetum cinerariifolium]
TFSSVRRPKNSGVIWKKRGSSNTYNVDLSSFSHLKLDKDVKRYSHKDLLSCNNSHLGETSSAYVCNDAMNVSCNSRIISPVSKMPFRKKPRDSMNKKTVEVTSGPLALIAEKTNVSRIKEKVVVSSDSEGSKADDFSELKKITTLLAKAFNRRKFYSKPTNNNLRTSSSY